MSERLWALALGLVLSVAGGTGCRGRNLDPWPAGAALDGKPATARDPAAVELFRQRGLGAFEAELDERSYACGTTTVIRRRILLEAQPELSEGPPARRWEPVARLTTLEYPRAPESSVSEDPRLTSMLGIGSDDKGALFDVRVDPAFRAEALAELQAYAAGLGADAVLEVHASVACEHHMWTGTTVSLDPWSSTSPLWTATRLLDLAPRDVRWHGLAVRYVD